MSSFAHEDASVLVLETMESVVEHMRSTGNAEAMKHYGEQLGLEPQATDTEVAMLLIRVADLLNAGNVRMAIYSEEPL